jgi:hypothetical protein
LNLKRKFISPNKKYCRPHFSNACCTTEVK